VRKLASSWHAKILLGLTILLHLVLTILATDITVEKGATIPIFIQLGLHFCLFLFFADLCLRLFDEKLEFFACKLNIFDTCVVAADILTEIMSYWDQSHIPSLSALRMLRAVRVVRVVGFLSDIRELYLMLHGIASAMKAIMWGAFLIGILTLVWAIMAVELIHPLTLQLAAAGEYESCEKCTSAFSSVGSAFLTFVSTILAGDSWGKVTMPIMAAYPWTVPFFIAVLFSINLGLLNLILAVIVERAEEAREEDVAQKRRERDHFLAKCKKRLKKMFHDLDYDGNGSISRDEMMDGMRENPEFADILHVMDFGADDKEVIFSMMDVDMNGLIDPDEFIEHLFKMRSHDTQTLLLFIKHVVLNLQTKLGVSATADHDRTSLRNLRRSLSLVSIRHDDHDPVGQIMRSSRSFVSTVFGSNTSENQAAKDDVMHSSQQELPSQRKCDESWHDWRQWEVMHEDFASAAIQEAAHDAGNDELSAVKRQIDEDLASMNQLTRLKIDDLEPSCLRTESSTIDEPKSVPPMEGDLANGLKDLSNFLEGECDACHPQNSSTAGFPIAPEHLLAS